METTGVFDAYDLMRESLRAVIRVLTRARIAFENPGAKKVTVAESERWLGAKDVKIIGEGHTLGTILQAYLVEK